MTVTYSVLVATAGSRGLPIHHIDEINAYTLLMFDGPLRLECRVMKSSRDAADFEANHKQAVQVSPKTEVVSQLEKDDKTLTPWFAYALTDASGYAEARIPIPAPMRYIAYGDAEFETRHAFDRIVGLYVRDDDRLIAWQVALSIDPEATEPVADAVIQGMGEIPGVGTFPEYPILDGFMDSEMTTGPELYAGGPPQWGRGMSMTFSVGAGLTEVGPVGGYGQVPGSFWFVVQVQKGEKCPVDERAGVAIAISIDGAKPK